MELDKLELSQNTSPMASDAPASNITGTPETPAPPSLLKANGPFDALPRPEKTPAPFVLLDSIHEYGPERLTAVRRFNRAPIWQGLESMAQAAALHQRILTNFTRHAFLLSYDTCYFPKNPVFDGQARITARLSGQSRDAAEYETTLTFSDLPLLQARLHIGLTPYGPRFRADVLTTRYKELFTCLLNKNNTSC